MFTDTQPIGIDACCPAAIVIVEAIGAAFPAKAIEMILRKREESFDLVRVRFGPALQQLRFASFPGLELRGPGRIEEIPPASQERDDDNDAAQSLLNRLHHRLVYRCRSDVLQSSQFNTGIA